MVNKDSAREAEAVRLLTLVVGQTHAHDMLDHIVDSWSPVMQRGDVPAESWHLLASSIALILGDDVQRIAGILAQAVLEIKDLKRMPTAIQEASDEGWSALPQSVREALAWWAGEDNPCAVPDGADTTPHVVTLVRYVQRHENRTTNRDQQHADALLQDLTGVLDLDTGLHDVLNHSAEVAQVALETPLPRVPRVQHGSLEGFRTGCRCTSCNEFNDND